MFTLVEYTKRGTIRKRRPKVSRKERSRNKIQKLSESHPVLEGCDKLKCRLKCNQNFSHLQRTQVNNEYWKMDWFRQRSYILSQCSREDVKRRTLKTEDSQRNMTVKYYIHNESGEKTAVCKIFFLTTLGYNKKNDGVIFRALSTSNRNSTTPVQDRRGRHPSTKKVDRNSIEQHVESFHPTVSHYRREHAPNVRYLPSDVSLSFMYKDYCDKNPNIPISYDLYRKVVKEMHIHFTKLGHEECEKCECFNLHNPEHKQDSLNLECDICNSWSDHINKAKMSRDFYRQYADSDLDVDTICVSVDLQKVIMLPRIDTFKSVVFTKRLTTYNESFVPVGTKQKNVKPLAIIWHEAISGRNKEDIVSAFHYFFMANRDKKNVVLWLDNCTAQNKNWCLLSYFIYIVNSSKVLIEKIEVNYFEAGHTFMSADSFHHQIEKSLKQQKKTYDFQDFIMAVSLAHSGKVTVKAMEISDFCLWRDWHSVQKVNNTNYNNPKPYLAKIVQITAKRGSTNLCYKTSFEGEEYILNFIKPSMLKKVTEEPQPLKEPKGIDSNTKTAILKVLGPLMVKNRLEFWKNLPIRPE